MSWWGYYTYPGSPYWYYPPMPPDPMYLMATAYQWLVIPYYYMLTLEMYRAIIDIWKKSIENLTKMTELKQ
ncbi:MAG: hypothetical protein DRO40_10555 [Thermoprotei archaeon]|nr:MAG: hypothetical protein DRO40_10555 [Thermoprotei archaeon]